MQIIPIGAGPTWLAALENRKVDVALTAPPVPETAISRGFAIMFINNAKGEDPSIPEFLMENLVARPETVAERARSGAAHGARAGASQSMGAQEHAEQVAEALKPCVGQNRPPDLLLAGAAAVLPALSPDGRTTERSFQVTQDILEQAGISEEAHVLRRAGHQRVPRANDRPRTTVCLPADLRSALLLAFWELQLRAD